MTKVITYGTFDLFHEGHYRLLKRAKALGDYLIVGVTTEAYDKTRGKLNVVDSLVTRIENIKKTGFADEIIIEETEGQKFNDIKRLGIDIFTVGSDWTGCFDYLKDYCKVVYLERTKNISSTMLREQNSHIQRVGIIGTGRIAARFMPEAKLVSGISAQGCITLTVTARPGSPKDGKSRPMGTWKNSSRWWMWCMWHRPTRPTMDISKRLWRMGSMSSVKSPWCWSGPRRRNCSGVRRSGG